MARINLLPWREERRKQQQIEFFVILGIAAAVTLLIWGGIHMHYSARIDYQNSRNQFLETQIARLDKKIQEIEELEKEKERLLARMRAIEQLQTNRPLIVRLFDELVNSLPDGVSVTKVEQSGKQITINGVAQSNARVIHAQSGEFRVAGKSRARRDSGGDGARIESEQFHAALQTGGAHGRG